MALTGPLTRRVVSQLRARGGVEPFARVDPPLGHRVYKRAVREQRVGKTVCLGCSLQG